VSVALTYPGVRVLEIPSGVRTISGVATSIAAFVGTARWGPPDEPVTINNFGDFERRFGGLWAPSYLGYAVRHFYMNGGGQAIVIRVVGANAAAATIEIAGDFQLVAANPGAWGNALTVDVDPVPNSELFNVTVKDASGIRERYLNVSVDASKRRYLPRVLEASDALVRVAKDDTGAFELPAAQPPQTSTTATADSGANGDTPDTNAYTGSQADRTGIFALEDVDLFNLLVIPPAERDADTAKEIYQAAITYCHDRRAVLLVDAGSDWTSANAPASRDGLGLSTDDTSYGAIYFPWVQAADPLRENQVHTFPPTGAVAGVIARTDGSRGVWKAPAGTDAGLNGLAGLTVSLTDEDNGQLNPVAINCLRSFPVWGRVVWGARTLKGADQQADEYKYLPVRRLALYLEESLYRGLKWVVFEPNDEPLWSQIRLNVGAFMQNLFRQGAFQGNTPAKAYFVKCDSETTTQNDINLGVVNILVGFAPLKPAEFVVLRIQQIAGQIET
jgi:Bacteriophage tail sheath protein